MNTPEYKRDMAKFMKGTRTCNRCKGQADHQSQDRQASHSGMEEKGRKVEERMPPEYVEINGVKFKPNPECQYRHDYVKVAELISSGEWDELSTYRALIQNDLFFVFYFVVKPFADEGGMEKANHPFTVDACYEVETGPVDFTLDLWARFHFKSSIITIAETIQYAVKNRNMRRGFFHIRLRLRRTFYLRSRRRSRGRRFYTSVSPTLCGRTAKRKLRFGLWTRG